MFDIFGNVFGRKRDRNSGQNGGSSSTGNPSSQSDEDFVCVQENGTIRESSSQPVYPTLQLTNHMFQVTPNTSLNESNPTNTMESPSSPTFSPIDNLPFIVTSSCHLVASSVSDLSYTFKAIDRVGVFLSSVHQSEYNFDIERSIIREST